MDDTKKDWIKHILGRWFSSGDFPEEKPPDPSLAPQESSVTKDAGSGTESKLKAPPIAMEVSRKLSALRNAVELGGDATSRLCNVHSTEDLLLYSYEVIFRKFMSFQEIGLVSAQSSLALDAIHRKYQSILKNRQPESSGIDPAEKKRLEDENKGLRDQLKKLKAEFVKKGIISEREIKLDEEVNYLQRRLREHAVQLEVSRKKNEVALAGVEMANALLAKNGLLNARLANQERLLRALTAQSPKQEEMLSKLDALREENRRLREVVQDRSESETELKELFGADPESSQMLDGLLAANRDLKEELARNDGRLDGLASAEPQTDVTETIERLSNENFELTTIFETGRAIRECAQSRESGDFGHERIVDLLKVENQRLQTALSAKEEQLKALSSNPAHRSMMKAIIRIKDENRRLSKALEVRGRLHEQWEEEKKQLQIQSRRSEELMRENLAIRTKLESGGQIIKSLQKTAAQYQSLKKEYSVVLSKYDAAQVEILNMKKQLSKVTAQYEMMIKEYENIFGQFK